MDTTNLMHFQDNKGSSGYKYIFVVFFLFYYYHGVSQRGHAHIWEDGKIASQNKKTVSVRL